MNNQFDELTKGMAQSVTRRAALKKFGVGLAGMALACFGLANKAGAATNGYCEVYWFGDYLYTGACLDINSCLTYPSAQCPGGTAVTGGPKGDKTRLACGYRYASRRCSR